MARTESEFKSILTEHDDSALARVRVAASSTASAVSHIGAPVVASSSPVAHAAPTVVIAPATPVTVVATYDYSASGASGEGAESGTAHIVVYSDHTIAVTLTSTAAKTVSDGQSLSSIELKFASAPPAVTADPIVGTGVQLVDIGSEGSVTNVSGNETHWGTGVSGTSVFLATAGTGAKGGQPDDLITDTLGGYGHTANSFQQHSPNIANSATFTFKFSGAPPVITGANFGFGTNPQNSGYTLPGTPACYLEGTRIAVSPTASMAIESLKIGDLVLTDDGRQVPVLWIGRQGISRIFADTLRAMPIRIKASALAKNLPLRDLLVSSCHAILVDGILVQAGVLVNGTSIVRETKVPDVFTYYHVELEDHSLILAEGVAAETFVDNAARMTFDNWSEHEALFPEGRPMVEIDLPRVTSARHLPAAIARRLSDRAVGD